MDAPLNFDRHGSARFEQPVAGDSFTVSEVVEQLTGFVRRQFPIFVFIVACSLALGLVYLATTPPSFTSHAIMLIDSSKLRVLQQQDAPIGDIPIDTAQVETQVEVLKSENIGLSVIKELKLADDPEFAGSGGGLIGKVLAYFDSSEQQSESQLTRRALGQFVAKRTVTRVGRTYVLDIGYTSLDATRSAAIANAIADAYIVDQLEAKYQATKRASVWLQDRIKELRQQASDADRAVLDYKEKNKIVTVSGTSASGPRLLGEQQIDDMNTQLGTARAAAEEAKARLERINEVLKKDVPDATVADTLHSEVINRLRNNYLDLAAKEAIWSARYGANHLAAVNLRTQMFELRRAMQDELGRIAEGYKSDYEISKSRVDGLERSLGDLVANSQATNRDRLGLNDLESTAKVYHTIYDNFLQRYMEAIQQQSFPITEARVISAAAAPQRKSGPIASTVLGIAGLIGIMLSFGAAVLREAMDQVFRTTREVENTLHTNCLAVLPLLGGSSALINGKNVSLATGKIGSNQTLSGKGLLTVKSEAVTARAGRAGPSFPEFTQADANRGPLRKDGLPSSKALTGKREISLKKPMMRQVVDNPLSAFTEAFRSIKVAADIVGARKDNKVIGITSTVAGEGKSTVASNFAQLIAHSGKRVILVDGDLRNPSASRALAPDSDIGLLQVLNNDLTLNEAILADSETGLQFLPVGGSRLVHTNEVLASESFATLIRTLRKTYDYVIVDFPPLAPVVDVRAVTQVVDSFIYVVEWGKTRKNLAQHQLLTAPEVHERLLGAVLNKANVRVLERYEAYYGRNYYKSYYGDRSTEPA